jgi:hypothetical protein
MGNEKSILEKITDTVKDIATLATDAASHALKAEETPLKVDERAAAYVPLAADGLVSDPMMVPPVAMASPARKSVSRKRAAKRGGKKTARKAKRKAPEKSAGKAAKKSGAKKKSAATRSKQPAKRAVKKSSRKSASNAAKRKRKSARG